MISLRRIAKDYFEWMCSLVCDSKEQRMSYTKLLSYLHDRKFTWTIVMDENRAKDGTDLRYRYGNNNDISEAILWNAIGNRPCSIFEMLVALSLRIEETIMDDPDSGNRTSQWFWLMMKNLGLYRMNDVNFDEETVDFIVTRFLDRMYESDGRGGLVYIPNPREDLRYVEIWYQLMWYLSNNYL